jgi:formylglycine-generating enzyme required for sulfatase activity
MRFRMQVWHGLTMTGFLLTSPLPGVAQETVRQAPPQTSSQEDESPQEDERLLHMVLVPAGEFRMGSLEDDDFAESNEKPQRTIRLDAFYIDKLEVTNIEYKRFTDATGYPPPEAWRDGKYSEGADFYPVQSVSWWEAMAYARWIGKRLPTEAEWEKAARGTDARRFPWGDQYEIDLANSDKDYAPVASYFNGASPYGVLNMAGNVAEWTASAYAPYPHVELSVPDEFGGTGSAPRPAETVEIFRQPDAKQLEHARYDYPEDHPLRQFFTPQELADQRQRVYRGGSINNYARFLRCANRQKSKPGDRWYNVGFRCAMDVHATTEPAKHEESSRQSSSPSRSALSLEAESRSATMALPTRGVPAP